jgi:hypothetical protein
VLAFHSNVTFAAYAGIIMERMEISERSEILQDDDSLKTFSTRESDTDN